MATTSRMEPLNRAAKEHYAKVERVVFESDAGDFVILKLADGLSACGPACADDFHQSTSYRFMGRWEDDAKFGPRFKFVTFTVHKPHGRAGVVLYLAKSCPGIGEAYANQIFERYLGNGIDILRDTPARVAEELRIPAEVCERASESLRSTVKHEGTKVDLYDVIGKRGFPGKLIDEAIRKWGARAPEVIRANPFKMLGLPGAGFKRCDKLYQELGLPKDATHRQVRCLAHLLRTDNTGHTWHDAEYVRDRLLEAIPGADFVRAARVAVRARLIQRKRDAEGKLWIAEYQKAAAEEKVARSVARLLACPRVEWPTDRIPVSQREGDRLPSEHQVERLKLATAGAFGLLLGGPGTGKAMPLGTKVLTPKGYREIGGLNVGDAVVGSNGCPTLVSGVYPQGVVDTYRVRFSDGSSVECCGEHLWYTTTRAERKKARRNGDSLSESGKARTTIEISKTLLSSDGYNNHYIPLVQPVEFHVSNGCTVDPYLLGLLLGDAHIGNGCVQFTNPDEELADYIKSAIPEGCEIVRHNKGEGSCPSYQISKPMLGTPICERNPLLRALREMGLAGLRSHEKFIPDRYKFGTAKERKALMQGLLDTDGYAGKTCVEYCTSSPRLADDFVHIVESLGGTCSVAWKKSPAFTHNGLKRIGKPSARILVKIPSYLGNPFRLKRKSAAFRPRTKYQPYRQIVSIEYVGQKESVCISVTAKDQLYVADRFIVTHNTHTLSYLVREIVAEFGWSSLALCAPTGKAAVRMTQALEAAGLYGARAVTIHTLLQIAEAGYGDQEWKFKFNAGNFLPYRFLFVDELSMLDTTIAAKLFEACGPGTHVLGIGDPYQLPPVGHGAPLRDLIEAGVPHGELTQVRRNAGMIVHACQRIKNGESFDTADKVDLAAIPPANLKLIHAGSEEEAAETLVEVVKRMTLFNAAWQTQVVVARNAVRKELNDTLQALLNGGGQKPMGDAKFPFRVGDKVICTRNSRFPEVELVGKFHEGYREEAEKLAENYVVVPDASTQSGKKECYIANGEIGRVLANAKGQMVVRFSERETLVVVYVGKGKHADDDDGAGGGKEEESGRGCNVDLAYAVTTHKMQGSEAPCVIVVADPKGGMLCDRSWWYTAISRAAKLCLVIGSRGWVDSQRMRQSLVRRKTFLVEMLKEVMES